MERLSLRPAIEASPQASARVCPELEIAIEREFNNIRHGNNGRFFQPNAMLYAVQVEHGMPTVRALPQLTIAQVGEIQTDLRMRAYEQHRPDWDHRHQSLRRPEDGLFNKGLIGISREKPTPNAGGIRYSRRTQVARTSDGPVGKRDCDASTPTQSQLFPPPQHDHKSRQTISS